MRPEIPNLSDPGRQVFHVLWDGPWVRRADALQVSNAVPSRLSGSCLQHQPNSSAADAADTSAPTWYWLANCKPAASMNWRSMPQT